MQKTFLLKLLHFVSAAVRISMLMRRRKFPAKSQEEVMHITPEVRKRFLSKPGAAQRFIENRFFCPGQDKYQDFYSKIKVPKLLYSWKDLPVFCQVRWTAPLS